VERIRLFGHPEQLVCRRGKRKSHRTNPVEGHRPAIRARAFPRGLEGFQRRRMSRARLQKREVHIGKIPDVLRAVADSETKNETYNPYV
jgi:hypothetical protein